jgi:hypothetical protein
LCGKGRDKFEHLLSERRFDAEVVFAVLARVKGRVGSAPEAAGSDELEQATMENRHAFALMAPSRSFAGAWHGKEWRLGAVGVRWRALIDGPV